MKLSARKSSKGTVSGNVPGCTNVKTDMRRGNPISPNTNNFGIQMGNQVCAISNLPK